MMTSFMIHVSIHVWEGSSLWGGSTQWVLAPNAVTYEHITPRKSRNGFRHVLCRICEKYIQSVYLKGLGACSAIKTSVSYAIGERDLHQFYSKTKQ